MRLLKQLLKPINLWIAITNALTRSPTPSTKVPSTFPLIGALTHIDRDCTIHRSSEVRGCQIMGHSSIGPRVILETSVVDLCTKIRESWVAFSELS